MSIDSTLGSITSLTNQVQTGIGTVLNTGTDLGLSGLRGSDGTPWHKKLQPASFRGVPFNVLSGDSTFGRRNVVHEYPFRDTVWVEDLGRSARHFEVQGFLVGEDCIARRDALIAACERPDDGDSKLVHPTYGEKTVTLLGRLKVTERWDKGRMFEVSFSFIESGKRQFPTDQQSTGNVVVIHGSRTDAAAAADFSSRAASALKAGAAVVQAAVNQTTVWVQKAQRLANDATNLTNLVRSLPGDFGRFASQGTGLLHAGGGAKANTTVAALIAQSALARETVSTSAGNLSSAAAGLSATSTSAFASAAQAQAATVLAAVNDPADGIRLLQTLAAPLTQTAAPASPIGQSITTIQGATGDLFRRAAVVAIARASADYQPASVDDAAAVRATVCSALDAEIMIAGNQYEDATYNALRSLRAAVSADLAARGAGLPSVITVSTGLPMPALALAQRVYRDAGRADAMVTQSGAIHPAFMPTRFKALA